MGAQLAHGDALTGEQRAHIGGIERALIARSVLQAQRAVRQDVYKRQGYNYPEALVAALGAGLGFLLAMVLFSGVRRRVDEAEPPKAFKGMPITLISAALVSLSFMCFAGVADNLFGVL